MRVLFVDGPLEGREEEIADDGVQAGQPIYWPERPKETDEAPATPGVDDVVEYVYEGNGQARYVGGQLGDT
jgi:hypothetical protein